MSKGQPLVTILGDGSSIVGASDDGGTITWKYLIQSGLFSEMIEKKFGQAFQIQHEV
jgi:hypothetical protein